MVIHLVIPTHHEGLRGAGQWKDLQGIRIALSVIGLFQEFHFDGGNLSDLVQQLGDSSDTVIWYYSFWPEALEALKRHCPNVRIVLRTVNAEALQHWTRAGKDWRRLRGLPRDIYGVLRLLLRDRRCARAADALAGISHWDDAHYWRWLAHRGKRSDVPYLSPWPGLCPEANPMPWGERENVIACFAGTRDTIGRGHITGFSSLAKRPELSAWRFVSSDGFMDASRDRMPSHVERLGHIDDPWSWLCRIKAVAVLSPFGYGYKTTVTDALVAGCHVVVHPRQHARLSDIDKRHAVPFDPEQACEIEPLMQKICHAPGSDALSVQRAQMDVALNAWQNVLAP